MPHGDGAESSSVNVGDIVRHLPESEQSGRYSAIREQLDALLARVAQTLADLPEGDPLPLSDAQVERIRLAIGVFPALRVHRALIERLGIDLSDR